MGAVSRPWWSSCWKAKAAAASDIRKNKNKKKMDEIVKQKKKCAFNSTRWWRIRSPAWYGSKRALRQPCWLYTPLALIRHRKPRELSWLCIGTSTSAESMRDVLVWRGTSFYVRVCSAVGRFTWASLVADHYYYYLEHTAKCGCVFAPITLYSPNWLVLVDG